MDAYRRTEGNRLTHRPEVVKSLEFFDKVLAQYDECGSNSPLSPPDSHSCPDFTLTSSMANDEDEYNFPDNIQSESIKRKVSGLVMSFEQLENKSLVSTSCSSNDESPKFESTKSQAKGFPPPVPKRSSATRLSAFSDNLLIKSEKESKITDSLLLPKYLSNTSNEKNTKSEGMKENILIAVEHLKDNVSTKFSGQLSPQIKKALPHKNCVSIHGKGTSADNLKLLISERKQAFSQGSDYSCVKKTCNKHVRSASDGCIAKCCEYSLPTAMPEMYTSNERRLRTDDHYRELEKRFKRVKQLLKENKIKGLDEKPPSFKPPPPPSKQTTAKDMHSIPAFGASTPKNEHLLRVPSFQRKGMLNNVCKEMSHGDGKNKSASPPDSIPVGKCLNDSVSSSETNFSFAENISPIKPVLNFQVSLEDSFSEIKEVAQAADVSLNGKTTNISKSISQERKYLSTFKNTKASRSASVRQKCRDSSLSPLRERVSIDSSKARALPSNGLPDGKHRKSSLSSLMERIPTISQKANSKSYGAIHNYPHHSSFKDRHDTVEKASTLPNNTKQSYVSEIVQKYKSDDNNSQGDELLWVKNSIYSSTPGKEKHIASPKANTLPNNTKQTYSVPEMAQKSKSEEIRQEGIFTEKGWNWKRGKSKRHSERLPKRGAKDKEENGDQSAKAGDRRSSLWKGLFR